MKYKISKTDNLKGEVTIQEIEIEENQVVEIIEETTEEGI